MRAKTADQIFQNRLNKFYLYITEPLFDEVTGVSGVKGAKEVMSGKDLEALTEPEKRSRLNRYIFALRALDVEDAYWNLVQGYTALTLLLTGQYEYEFIGKPAGTEKQREVYQKNREKYLALQHKDLVAGVMIRHENAGSPITEERAEELVKNPLVEA